MNIALTISYTVSFCVAPYNIALLQPVTMSTERTPGCGAYAVDGNPSPNFAQGCAHSEGGGSDDPWWTVDFGEVRSVVGVDIVNRGDCSGCGKRDKQRL